MVSQKIWITMKICDNLLLNGMACHHHMEDLRQYIFSTS
jgi:hypothetical protein